MMNQMKWVIKNQKMMMKGVSDKESIRSASETNSDDSKNDMLLEVDFRGGTKGGSNFNVLKQRRLSASIPTGLLMVIARRTRRMPSLP